MAVGQRGCRTVNKLLNQLIILSLNPAHPQHCAVASGLLWCVKRFGMANALWSVSSALGVGRTRSSRSCRYTEALQGIIQDSGGIPPEQWAVSGMVKKSRAGARDTHASLKPQQKSRKRFYLIPKRRQHEHVPGPVLKTFCLASPVLRLPRCISTGPVVVRLAEREMNVNVNFCLAADRRDDLMSLLPKVDGI